MSEEDKAAATTAPPEDDAIVVHDEAAEEKAHAELIADVTKMLDETPAEDGKKPQPGEEEKPSEAKAKDEEPATGEKPESADAELSDELQARAEGAGVSKDLAQRLHQSGQLEEALAAFDRALIERFADKVQSKEAEEKPERRESLDQREAKPPPVNDEKLPPLDPLDPEVYDEELVKRDAHHNRRIDALESQLAELLQDGQRAFDKRFDGMIDGLGHKDLFGTGDSAPKDKQANRDTLFRAYQAVCMAHDVDPHDCDPQWGKRAMAAMFPDDVFKKAQQQTVDRLREAEGKFLSSSRSRGAPPAKGATEEEVHDKLVSDVTTYLKKEGVQMSGV